MDLETFITILYVIIDDWYKAKIMAQKSPVGRPAKLSDSEVVTLVIASNWRYGVPWQSERGFIRYMQAHGITLFPSLLNISAFNQRVRYLYGVIVELHHELASRLITSQTIFECFDTLELPAYSLGEWVTTKNTLVMAKYTPKRRTWASAVRRFSFGKCNRTGCYHRMVTCDRRYR